MEQKNEFTKYRIKGLVGIAVSIIIILIGVYYKHVSILGFLTPLGLLFGVFFAGYQMKGKVKDGIKWVISLVILFSIIILLNYLRK